VLSNLEAVWIGRLYKVIPNMEELLTAARRYAVLENTIERMGKYPDNPETMDWLIEKDAIIYGTMTGDYSLARDTAKDA